MKSRCINIDWLEVFCIEPFEPRTADFFRERGYRVEKREYGTRVYSEMFTIYGGDHWKLLEIRRNPVSDILPVGACHIRFSNRTCYFDDSVSRFIEWLEEYDYIVKRISRIDLCLDFEKFDSGDEPVKFIRRYMEGKYSKINQSDVSAHGLDTWEERKWNSLSWGSRKSAISVKLYNKTKELEEVHDKPYIKQAWFESGLIDSPITMEKVRTDGKRYKPQIYRLEISISSSVNNWVVINPNGKETVKQSIRNVLDMYKNKASILALFSSLVEHYFHFRYYQAGVIKYKCERKKLFDFGTQEQVYSVGHPASPNDRDKKLQRLMSLLRLFQQLYPSPEIAQAVETIAEKIQSVDATRMLSNPFDRRALAAFQQAVSLRMKGQVDDFAEAYNLLKEIYTCEDALDVWV